jgi:ribokinase
MLVVIGSANADLYVGLTRMPIEGETLPAVSGGELRPGGKGANQSAAASLLGIKTYFLGQIGKDPAGAMLESELAKRNVDLEYLKKIPDVATGQAVVMLLPLGLNSIIIIGGANQAWDSLDEFMRSPIEAAKALLLQREVPEIINIQAARIAKAKGNIVLLDSGGKLGFITNELLEIVDILSPNKTELEEITGIKGDLEASANFLLDKGVKHLVIKLSNEGSLYISKTASFKQDAIKLEGKDIIDTTGAGDCYTAALIVRLIELGGSLDLEHFQIAMKFASVAAFLSITKKGAMESMPTRDDVEQYL